MGTVWIIRTSKRPEKRSECVSTCETLGYRPRSRFRSATLYLTNSLQNMLKGRIWIRCLLPEGDFEPWKRNVAFYIWCSFVANKLGQVHGCFDIGRLGNTEDWRETISDAAQVSCELIMTYYISILMIKSWLNIDMIKDYPRLPTIRLRLVHFSVNML